MLYLQIYGSLWLQVDWDKLCRYIKDLGLAMHTRALEAVF